MCQINIMYVHVAHFYLANVLLVACWHLWNIHQ